MSFALLQFVGHSVEVTAVSLAMANDLPLSINGCNGYREARLGMVELQLRCRGIRDPRVIDAMSCVPRHEFVPRDVKKFAYEDHAIAIGYGQTISQPLMVAVMCEAAQLSAGDRVLEVGTGSGYGAAVLSKLAAEVHTVERIPALVPRSSETLTRLGYNNVHVHLANGSVGWPAAGPYDAILVTAAAESLPMPYLEQIARDGRIIIPIGERWYGQTMFRVRRKGRKPTFEALGGCAFVPLIGDYGREEGLTP